MKQNQDFGNINRNKNKNQDSLKLGKKLGVTLDLQVFNA